MRSVALGMLIGVTLAVVFTAGFFVRELVQIPPIAAGATTSTNFGLLDEVQVLLERNYLRELPDPETQQYAAIRGLLGALQDRNTFFIEPVVARSESDVLAGTYGGIGVQLQRSTEGDFLLFPLEDSPALAAGITDGDVLLRINGEEVRPTDQQDAVDQRMRGEVGNGNGVEISVRKADASEFTTFIPFDVINIPSVFWRMLSEDERIGYVQIIRFTNRTPGELTEGLNVLRNAGAQALVLDLRNNSGGLLEESISVADAFLPGGVAVYEITNRGERAREVGVDGIMLDLPLAVIVNRGTASASELVAGAIADNGRGVLIGQTTFGKGTIQQIFALSDRSSVHITSSEWLTPGRRVIEGNGLEPDIPIEPDDSGRDLALIAAIEHLSQQLQQ